MEHGRGEPRAHTCDAVQRGDAGGAQGRGTLAHAFAQVVVADALDRVALAFVEGERIQRNTGWQGTARKTRWVGWGQPRRCARRAGRGGARAAPVPMMAVCSSSGQSRFSARLRRAPTNQRGISSIALLGSRTWVRGLKR